MWWEAKTKNLTGTLAGPLVVVNFRGDPICGSLSEPTLWNLHMIFQLVEHIFAV